MCTPVCTLLLNMRTPIDLYAYSIKIKIKNYVLPLCRKSDKRRFPALGVDNDLTAIFDKDELIFFFIIVCVM